MSPSSLARMRRSIANEDSYYRTPKREAETVPLGRIGKAEEVAESIYFLASEGADYITGQMLSIDGGIA